MTYRNSQLVESADKFGSPLFAYDFSTIENELKRIRQAIRQAKIPNKVQLYYPIFTNPHPRLLRFLAKQGLGFLVQTSEEIEILRKAGLRTAKIVASPGVLSNDELAAFTSKQILVNAASIQNANFVSQKTQAVGIRLDLDGNFLKSLRQEQFPELMKIVSQNHAKIVSVHSYPGTQENEQRVFSNAKNLFWVWKSYFNEATEINLGSGYPFYYDGSERFNWNKYFAFLRKMVRKFSVPKTVTIALEPGRILLAKSGNFVCKVVDLRKTGPFSYQVYTDGSYVFIPSATVKNRQHAISIIGPDGKMRKDAHYNLMLVGSTTLAFDTVLPGWILAPKPKVGDLIVIHDVGAYAAGQFMRFLNKKSPVEVLVEENKVTLITKRGTATDSIRHCLI